MERPQLPYTHGYSPLIGTDDYQQPSPSNESDADELSEDGGTMYTPMHEIFTLANEIDEMAPENEDPGLIMDGMYPLETLDDRESNTNDPFPVRTE